MDVEEDVEARNAIMMKTNQTADGTASADFNSGDGNFSLK
jgi:hypothetical protein